MFIFEAVTIAAGAVGLAVYGSPALRPQRTLDELGRHGAWFAHADELPIDELPSEEHDAPIPVRPLRTRLR